nr:urease accessory protein UreF [Corynebacterium tapiri]
MQLTDSALPTGAFAHSMGFETYMAAGQITDHHSFQRWLQAFTAQQLTFTDALAVRMVYRADRFADIADLDHMLTAQALPEQVRTAGMTMGKRLISMASANYQGEWIQQYSQEVSAQKLWGHPACAWALVARELGIDQEEAVAQHVYATIIALTQNAVRAIPLGQNAGQEIIFRAQEWVERAVEVSWALEREDLGAISPGLEIAQMNHERQRARMFMS